MWTFETFAALAALAVASTWTPGPNNAMLAASGATFGFRRTLPHAMGVALGFSLMMFLTALGLAGLFKQSALLREGLRWAGTALLLWIAWRIATARAPGAAGGPSRPFTFLQAAAFQWVNPKAWAMCVAVVSQFVTGAAPLREAASCALVFVASGLTSAHGWAAFGAGMGRVLGGGARLRAFNLCMGAMVAAGAAMLAVADLG